jgi:hypothetical protein
MMNLIPGLQPEPSTPVEETPLLYGDLSVKHLIQSRYELSLNTQLMPAGTDQYPA